VRGHFKIILVQISEVDALPAPFSIAHQWVGIDKHCWVSIVMSHIIFGSWNHGKKEACTEVDAIPAHFSLAFNVFSHLLLFHIDMILSLIGM
jgi:hypothetical protein